MTAEVPRTSTGWKWNASVNPPMIVSWYGFAQLQRKPVIKKAKPAGEYENAVAYVLGLYTCFAILHLGFTAEDFTRLHKRAIYNYYLNHSSRQIRHVYDTGWGGKYTHRNIFYPLG